MATHESQRFNGNFTVFDAPQFHARGRTLFVVVIIFTVVLLVTVLLLYTRWVCRYHRHPASSDVPPRSQPKGLDPAVIRGLPIVLFQQSGRDLEAGGYGGECCICLGVFEEREKVKVLPNCRHCYHWECVDTWLATQSSCPLCRAQLHVHSTDSA